MNRYQKAKIRKDFAGKRYMQNVIYPLIPETLDDVYVETEYGDRVDILAYQFYNDSSLWWIVSSANGDLPQNSYYIPEGKQIRIPQNIAAVISQFKALNGR